MPLKLHEAEVEFSGHKMATTWSLRPGVKASGWHGRWVGSESQGSLGEQGVYLAVLTLWMLERQGEPEKGRRRHKPMKESGIHLRIRKEKGSADPRDKITWGGRGLMGTLPLPCWPWFEGGLWRVGSFRGKKMKFPISGKWIKAQWHALWQPQLSQCQKFS